MANYTKLFSSILHSTIWQAPDHVRLVWITLLALKDRDGVVEASVPGLARAAGVSLTATEQALALLMAPDPYSRTPDHEGRRIVAVDGGWSVLNHDKYNDKSSAEEYKAKNAARQARLRARKAANVTLHNATVTPGNAESQKVWPSAPAPAPAPTPTVSDPDPETRTRQPALILTPRMADPESPGEVALRLWARLNAARMAAIPGARKLAPAPDSVGRIVTLLESYTPADVEAVIDHLAERCKTDKTQWQHFDGVTPFRPENFARTLGKVGTVPRVTPVRAYNGRG